MTTITEHKLEIAVLFERALRDGSEITSSDEPGERFEQVVTEIRTEEEDVIPDYFAILMKGMVEMYSSPQIMTM
jgi:hypothetical protein